jgi:hypothetical protein
MLLSLLIINSTSPLKTNQRLNHRQLNHLANLTEKAKLIAIALPFPTLITAIAFCHATLKALY